MAVWAEIEDDDEPSDNHIRQLIHTPINPDHATVSAGLRRERDPAEYVAHALRCYPYALCSVPKS